MNPPVQWSYERAQHGVAEFARLYVNGASLEEVCPNHLSEELERRSERLESFLRAFHQANIQWREIGLDCLVPDQVLDSFESVKQEIAEYIVSNKRKPENYEFLQEISYVCSIIAEQPLEKEYKNVIPYREDDDYDRFVHRTRYADYIYYDIFGSKTGRVGVQPNSFPILTLKKKYRDLLAPQNDLFVELDYDSAELRTVLELLGREQPDCDIHDWNRKNVFSEEMSRHRAKKRIFSWLYGGYETNAQLLEVYDREQLLDQFWNGERIKNPYGRTIEADRDHALSYLVQSTFADYFLRKVVEVYRQEVEFLEQSTLAFFIHDSLILDLNREDFSDTLGVKEIMEKDGYPVSVRAGQKFGSLEEVDF